MMYRSSLLCGFALFVGGPVLAQEGSTSVDGSGRLAFAGEATRACLIGKPEATGGVNATLTGSNEGTSSIEIGQLVSQVDASPMASSINLGFQVICNHAHSLSVRSGRRGLQLQQGAPASGAFGTTVDYTFGIAWSGQSRQANASSGQLQINAANGAAGILSVSIETSGSGPPLVAGTYSDSVIVELTPAN